jgi:serine/threonine-protein kinase
MTPERHEQVKSLFLALCALDEDKRPALLDRACGGDPELRAEVESLLAYHDPATLIEDFAQTGSGGRLETPGPEQTERLAARSAAAFSTSDGHDRFPPGAIVADRYRVVACLGSGGMGDVYRADDLKLGQTVALKFLSVGRGRDQVWLTRFYNEARLARTVTHANVCRVHDIGEAGGEAFLSMEYVDGEDLASLLRRIGRLPADKALQIARELCSGLAAAHDRGVLHRDLKPANIMLDGRGHVRITDFGIAVLRTDELERRIVAGTPRYMAPELLSGGEATVRSDIYSLGMVLYELVTGRLVLERDSLVSTRTRGLPRPPSTIVDDLDPVFDRIILQCLEQNPADRPASVHAVLTALPGGSDPLAAALAAGETPSPDMVASAGSQDATPTVAVACFAGGLLALLAVLLLADRTFLLSQAGLEKPPAVLADKAQEVADTLGGPADRRGRALGFMIDPAGLDYYRATDADRGSWANLLSAPYASPLLFEYRAGERPRPPKRLLDRPGPLEFAMPPPGMETILVDPEGRLVSYMAIPDPSAPAAARDVVDWKAAFGLAGLDITRFREIAPPGRPPLYATSHVAWEGTASGDPNRRILLEGGTTHGRIVAFRVERPWETADSHVSGIITFATARTAKLSIRYVVLLTSLFAATLLARRSIRLGRGDRRGAWRLAVLMFILVTLTWVFGHPHVADFEAESGSLLAQISFAVFTGAAVWVYYIALEPYVRRLWPHSIISWSRLLLSRLRDPMVGRDVLVGCLLGIGMVLVLQLGSLLASWAGLPRTVPLLPDMGTEVGTLLGAPHVLTVLIRALTTAISTGLVFLMVMLILRVLLRAPGIAGGAFFIVAAGVFMLVSDSPDAFPWATSAILAVSLAVVLIRVGLLAAIVGLFAREILMNSPLTLHVDEWYAGAAAGAVAVLLALMVFGLYGAGTRGYAGPSRVGPDAGAG